MSVVTLTIIISISGALCAVVGSILAVSNLFRTNRKEATTEAKVDAQSTTRVETKLEYISKGVDDIKLDMRDQGRQIGDINEKLARVDEAAKSAHKRIDELEK